MSEADEQAAVVEYCGAKGIPVYHVPNGGLRSKSEAARLKRQGVKAGVPDLCIPVPNASNHALYIEMKAEGGRVSSQQSEWIGLLRSHGNCAYVCYGAGNAIALIELYVSDGI